MENRHYNQLIIVIHAMLSIKGRITMLGLSRWSEKGGSYRTITRFFHSNIDWVSINWMIIKSYLIKENSVYILAGDEVVISKSGKKTYGIDRFYSSIQNQVIKSIAFLQLVLINVDTRKAYPIYTKQIIKENKTGCIKVKTKTSKEATKKRKVGRPEGSGNKDKTAVELSKYLIFIQDAIKLILGLIKAHISITYFVFDGEFGYNGALQMVKQTGLQLISKLQKNSELYYPYEGEYKGRGAPKKYGDKIDYKNIDDKYLKETNTEKKNIVTKIYQIEMLHKKFAGKLNIVIIQKTNTLTNKMAHITLFSSDLNLEYTKIIDYYSLRFQIEFVFRDAKQYWGMEDFMNIKKTAVNNGTNLSTFMVNVAHVLKKDFNNEDMSVLDIKAHYHGMKYANEVFKFLPEFPDDILIKRIYSKITSIGAIHPPEMAA
jgi:hypothetical protein